MTDNIMETVAELRRMHLAAHPAPWRLWEGYGISPRPHVSISFDNSGPNSDLVVAMRNALPALLDHIEGCEKSYDYAAKSWAEERARLNERIVKMEADRG